MTGSGVRLFRFGLLESYPLVQGISERSGGVSLPPLNSLNLGGNVGDTPGNIQENRRRLGAALGISEAALVSVHQVHGNQVVRVGHKDAGTVVGDADGMFTADEGLFMLMRFADCVPVLFYDTCRHVAGIAHAGWRGTASGVVIKTVTAMQREFGSEPADLVAAIGPSIGPCCYEVGAEVVEAILAVDAIPHSAIEQGRSGRPHVNLWEANAAQLRHAGVGTVEIARVCTACQSERFYSHRASGGHAGRFAAVIGLRGGHVGHCDPAQS